MRYHEAELTKKDINGKIESEILVQRNPKGSEIMASNYLNCSQISGDPGLLRGWFEFVDDRSNVDDSDLGSLASHLVDLVRTHGNHALWLNPESDGRRVGANGYNVFLELNGRRLRYKCFIEGALFSG